MARPYAVVPPPYYQRSAALGPLVRFLLVVLLLVVLAVLAVHWALPWVHQIQVRLHQAQVSQGYVISQYSRGQ